MDNLCADISAFHDQLASLPIHSAEWRRVCGLVTEAQAKLDRLLPGGSHAAASTVPDDRDIASAA